MIMQKKKTSGIERITDRTLVTSSVRFCCCNSCPNHLVSESHLQALRDPGSVVHAHGAQLDHDTNFSLSLSFLLLHSEAKNNKTKQQRAKSCAKP